MSMCDSGTYQTGPSRVVLVVPSSNTVMESDIYRALGRQGTLHTARMRLSEPITPERERIMLDEMLPQALSDLADVRPDVLVFGCSSATSVMGPTAAHDLRRQVSDVVGAPVIDAMEAITRGVQARDLRSVSVLTPYVSAVNLLIKRSLEEFVRVDRITGLGITANSAAAATSPMDILRHGLKALDPSSDGLVVMCTNFRALEARGELEHDLGVPVLTANSAVIDELAAALDPQKIGAS